MSRKTFNKTIIHNVFMDTTRPSSTRDPRQLRSDKKDRIIAKAAYGNRNSKFGWNIHHIDGDKNNNIKSNLQALHFETHDEIHNK